MKLIPYLFFDGTCEHAMQFYAQVFDGSLTAMQRWSDMPPNPNHPVAEDEKNRVMHVRMNAKGILLMASDGSPGDTHEGGNISLSLNFTDAAEGERLFNALSAEGDVETPLTDMFWGAKFGQFTDKFGIEWMFNVELAPAAAHT
jgi:PhnB protein